MIVTNGWTIYRDGNGFWLTAGTDRVGPFSRPNAARAWAKLTPAPVKPKPIKPTRRPVVDDDDRA